MCLCAGKEITNRDVCTGTLDGIIGKGSLQRQRLWMGPLPPNTFATRNTQSYLNGKPSGEHGNIVDSFLLSWKNVLYIAHYI